MKKRYLPLEEPQNDLYQTTRIPTDRPVAVYYRQSTDAQVGNISTLIQTIDMPQHLMRLGWAEKDIILIDMDEGVSGTTKIDERPGMQMLFDLISQGQIGTVACQDEDRLFRDITQIQVNIFIEACRKSNVLVLTPTMTYDFANPQTGTFHARQFRFKSEMAAEYINAVVRGKLHRAKDRLLREGRWGGAGIAPGYMVDMRKTLLDGSRNPQWKKFVVFEPYAQVVQTYFDMFLKNAGCLNKTLREIHEHGPYYPNPSSCKAPDGYKAFYRMQRYGEYYAPGRGGLNALLTNAVYLGHWMLNGSIIIWDNHPPLIDQETFMRAFNYLSKVTLDGQPNPDYRPFQQNARPSLESERGVERPICAGMMVSLHKGQWIDVGTNWVSPLNHYAYVLWENKMGNTNYVWSKAAKFVDDMVVKLLRAKLEATFQDEYWAQALASLEDELTKDSDRIKTQMEHLETVMHNQLASLESLTSPDLIQAVERRYEDAKAERARLRGLLETSASKAQQLEAIFRLRENYEPALENWQALNRDEVCVILQAFVEKIEATPVEKHGLRLVIRWRDETADEIVLARQNTTGIQWLPSEIEVLRSLVERNASQVEIAQTFPERQWQSIRYKLFQHFGKGTACVHPKPIKDDETFEDFQKRIDRDGTAYPTSIGWWRTVELEQLERLLDEGVTKMELVETFPYRNWNSIRTKITQLKGKSYQVTGVLTIGRFETYAAHTAQQKADTEESEDAETEYENGNSFRKSTPRCAKLTSPGRGMLPPPINPAWLMVWCGARNGRAITNGFSRSSSPATE